VVTVRVSVGIGQVVAIVLAVVESVVIAREAASAVGIVPVVVSEVAIDRVSATGLADPEVLAIGGSAQAWIALLVAGGIVQTGLVIDQIGTIGLGGIDPATTDLAGGTVAMAGPTTIPDRAQVMAGGRIALAAGVGITVMEAIGRPTGTITTTGITAVGAGPTTS
jgi:hypothetical protein